MVYNTTMSFSSHKLVEDIFFFAILGASAYLVWTLFAPFVGALALAAIIVTICYPMYERILKFLPRHNQSVAALLSLLVAMLVIVIPLVILASFILKEALSIYDLMSSSNQISFLDAIAKTEGFIKQFVPTFSIDTASIVQQTAGFIANNLANIFAGTASTLFLFFIALIASYYFFKDGRYFTSYLIKLSPLKNGKDELIFKRLATAVRSVALGTITVAVIQGILTAVGLSLLGFDRAILLGCVAAIGALIPGVGTTIVFVPVVVYLIYVGEQVHAIIAAVWGLFAVGLIDNIIGPYLMSRGNNLHPFLILLSVLGGISVFGPIGFILGPVILSLFLVLLELYHVHIEKERS